MGNVRPAFQVHEGTKAGLPIGYQQIKFHMIFDVKMGENFRQKARLVGGGHMTEAPPQSHTPPLYLEIQSGSH